MTAENDFPIPAGLVNGRYQLQSLIGHTNLGIDFLAHDVLLDRDVVFKALSAELTEDRSFVERFRAQAQTTANLTHPGLAAVLDWGRDPNGIERIGTPAYYLVSEYCAGRTVRELVDLNGPLPMNRALHVLVGVTSALSYAHRADVLHGGLSPDNVIVSPTGVVKVSDLGLSLALGPSWQPPTDRPDMALWRSPEQFRGDPIDMRTDVYQIGLLSYFLTTGRVPFPGDSVAQIAQRQLEVVPPAPSKLNAKIPKPLEGIIGRSLAKKSAERFTSVTEQRAALIRFRESRTSTAASPDEATASPASSAGAPVAAGLAATSVLSSAIGSQKLGESASALSGQSAEKLGVDRSSSDDATSMLASPDMTRVQTKSPDNTVHETGNSADRSDDSTADHLTETGGREHKKSRSERKSKTGAIADPEDVKGALAAPEGDFSELDHPKKRSGPLAFVILVLLAILGVLLWFLGQQLGLFGAAKPSILVPDVGGKTSAQAESTISAAGLIAETVTEPNASVPNDVVISQLPVALTKVAKESKVVIRVSTGVVKPVVPNVVGNTLEEATSKLRAKGFSINPEDVPDESSKPGTIISQEPRADTESAAGAEVKVRVASISGTIAIPDVTNQLADDAKLTLTKLLFRTSVNVEASEKIEKGKVIRTEPPAGTKVGRGSAVVIYRSGGLGTRVPQLRGLTQAEAETKMATDAPGLKLDVTTRPVIDPTEVGTVVAQSPAADSDADPGSTVSIRVGVLDDSPSATKKPPTTRVPVVANTTAAPTATAPSASGSAAVEPTVATVVSVAPAPTEAPATTNAPASIRTIAPTEAPAPTPPPVPVTPSSAVIG